MMCLNWKWPPTIGHFLQNKFMMINEIYCKFDEIYSWENVAGKIVFEKLCLKEKLEKKHSVRNRRFEGTI